MTERLLQYIWQFQYFNNSELSNLEGESLQVIHPGIYNTNQGPDFLDAKIRAGNTTWAGSVELHIKTSDWKNHRHAADANYKNIILHVVWQHDEELLLPFPTLVLEDRVPKFLLKKYDELMNSGSFIPCDKSVHLVNDLTWSAWKTGLLVERLKEKTKGVFEYLDINKGHWEETFWWLIAKNFGAKVNSEAFEQIARSIPLNLLAKHKNQVHHAESLLFGQAGLLDKKFTEDYPNMLRKEYLFYKNKYRLSRNMRPLFFLRMRPANFPSVRLAQLAMLIHTSLHMFSRVKESHLLKDIRQMLNVTANDYWHYHYVFDEITVFKKKNLGGQMIDNILINTIVPVLFSYGHYHGEISYKDKAIQWLEEIVAEQNAITRGFISLGVKNKTAFDSQALIQLKNEYCNHKRCLDCSIGNKLLNPQTGTFYAQ